LESRIGSGTFSEVFKVKRTTDSKLYALKKVSLEPLSVKERQNALNEVRILASISHPCIIGYKDAFLDEGKFLCIIMDFANDGDLFQKISKFKKQSIQFTELQVWMILIGAVCGLKKLHELKIFHRDIKSANLFLEDNGGARLGDMNVSKVAKAGFLYT
jgi:NIMA (never in mitosis gene a)-related kinase